MRLLHIFAAHVERPWRTRLSFLRRLLPRTGTDSFDPSIYGFILHYSRPEQIYLVIITIFSFPLPVYFFTNTEVYCKHYYQ
jgi:hypothetical protein